MKLFAGLSLVVSTTITWVLMFAYRPDPVLLHATLFSYQHLANPMTAEQVQLLALLKDHGIKMEALVFTGTQQDVLLNVPSLGKLAWLKEEAPSRRNVAAARSLRPLMRAVWQVAQIQLVEDGVNLNQVKTLGLWYPSAQDGLEVRNSLSDWGL